MLTSNPICCKVLTSNPIYCKVLTSNPICCKVLTSNPTFCRFRSCFIYYRHRSRGVLSPLSRSAARSLQWSFTCVSCHTHQTENDLARGPLNRQRQNDGVFLLCLLSLWAGLIKSIRDDVSDFQSLKCDTARYSASVVRLLRASDLFVVWSDVFVVVFHCSATLHALVPHRPYCCWLLLVSCLTSQQHTGVSQKRICLDNCSRCHNEISQPVTGYWHRGSQS